MSADARAELGELLRRLADGDRSACEPAYATLWPLVRAFCLRALPDGSGEDAAQLALLKVFERVATYDPSRDALPWVLSIAAWECRTLVARRRRQREVGDAPLSALQDESPSPERMVIEAQLGARASQLLATLSDGDRATLASILADERPAAVSSVTFRKRRERAIARLRSAWRRVYGE